MNLLTEQRDDVLSVIIFQLARVKTIEDGHLIGCCDVNVLQVFLSQESLEHGLVAFENLSDEVTGILVGIIFCFDLYLIVLDEDLHVERGVYSTVANADSLHGLAAHCLIVKQHTVPGKHRVTLQIQVGYKVTIGIDVVLAAAAHLLLSFKQQVKHGGIVGEFAINGQGFNSHTHRTGKAFIITSVIDCGEQTFLLVVELGQQVGIGGGEQRALEHAVLLAVIFYSV